MTREIRLIRQSDGSLIDWGRNATIDGVRGEGPARCYVGEDAEVLRYSMHAIGAYAPGKQG